MKKLTDLLKLEEDPTGGSAPLDGDLVEEIDAAVREAVEAGGSEDLLALVNPLIQKKGAGAGLQFAAARTHCLAGSKEIGSKLFLSLCERMEQQRNWEILSGVLDIAIDGNGNGSAPLARLAARVWEKGGARFAGIDLLRRSHGFAEDDHRILWALGNSLIEQGDDEGTLLVARSLAGFARKKEYDRVEEGMLILIEDARREELEHLVSAIEPMLEAGETDKVLTLFEFSSEAMIREGLSAKLWPLLRKHLEGFSGPSPLRSAAARFGPGAYPDILHPEKMFERSGVGNADVDIHDALAVLDKLLELPAGRYVYHHGWGVGRITDNDGEKLHIRFEGKPDHKMSLGLAATALLFLEPTDLRVKMFTDRDGVLRGARENRVELLYHVLEHLGGEASRDDIKKLLLHLGILTSSTWAEWWKNAKGKAEKDERFDFSRFFRKVVRLRGEDNAGVVVPEVSMEKNFRKALALLNGFLDQHPGGAADVKRRYEEKIGEKANSEETPPGDRMMGHLLLHRVGAGDEEGIRAALRTMAASLDMGTLSGEQQKLLLTIVPPDMVAVAGGLLLTSRIVTVRRAAWDALGALPGGEREKTVAEMLEKSPRGGSGVLHVVKELAVSSPERILDCLHALLYLLEEPEKETHRKDALDLVSSDLFRKALAEHEPTDVEREFLTSRLAHWKYSERFLFPVLEAFAGTRLEPIAEEVERRRSSARPDAVEDDLAAFGGRNLMTVATIEALRKEVEELDWDLKTSIPRMIREARELGDLRENAEYDAARQKQKDATKRLEELYQRIRLARPIEEIEFDPEKVGPGAEVELRTDDGESLRYWVLGEGDRRHGDEVISYLAPLGRALLGKKAGETAELPGGKRVTIVSLKQRLPEQSG